MLINEIKANLKNKEYDFLRDNEHLGDSIIFLGLGGSYGLNTKSSDCDIRGCAVNKKEEILLRRDFQQISDKNTDTTIYSFNKFISLLVKENPNSIEMLGLRPEHYLYISPVWQDLIDNSYMFLSKKSYYTFGAYSRSQLRRLDNKAIRVVDQTRKENHILDSIKNAEIDFKQKYFEYNEDNIKLYVDKSNQEEYDTEIFMDINLHHYPLRDYSSMWSEMQNIVKTYSKLGKRNQNAISHDKLGKHMCHLVRLFYMAFDILENEKIITYREKEYELLMNLKKGKYLDLKSQPIPEFYELVNDLEKRLEYAKENTSLPDEPNYDKINEFVMSVNERIVKGEI